MLSLDMLDVLIGMIFFYLLISLICSAINEIVESKLKLRAVDLEQGIRELLNDPNGNGIVDKFYNHPLIYSLFRGNYDPKQIRPNTDPKKQRYSRGSDLPSYIPAQNFALALMDIVLPATQSTPAVVTSPPSPAIPTPPGGSAAALAPFNDNLYTPANAMAPVNPNPLKPLRDTVETLPNTRVKQALLTIIDAAGDDAVKAREGIENWYNSSMDRVSGWYKRRVQTIVFWMGFAIAIIMNADSFAIFNNLANDRPLRNAIVAQAQMMKDSTQGAAETATDKLKRNVGSLLNLGLPIGWGWKSNLNNNPKAVSNLNAIPSFDSDTALGASLWQWFLKAFGWLVTGLAVSLGAPFWFDILNKVMVVRATVKPTEKSPEEASEDRQNGKS